MKRIALAFHLNQLTGPYIRTAASTSYRALLETLREHPELPFHLHVSGTLLAGLAWYAPDVLDLIRSGVAAGQFELFGSTYAQNIPESTPNACNDLQLAAHREQLERKFGVRPAGFWNPERCWSASYLPLIARSGYKYTLLETATMKEAGLAPHMPHRVNSGEASLVLVPDDPGFRAAFNLAIWTGEFRAVGERILALPDDGLLVHAEDAEAFGLWTYERGFSPTTDRANLSRLLSWLANHDKVEVVQLSRTLAAQEPADGGRLLPVRGQADWMVRALSDRSLPYHEDGYRDWFDFNARAPRLAHVRHLHGDVARVFLATVQTLKAPLNPAARRLVERGRELLAASQYELGCIGIGDVGWPAWELARHALLLVHAAVRASRTDELPPSGCEVLDRDRDGVPEIFLQVGSDLVILSPVGGRVLAWIDLATGDVLAGAALGLATPGPYKSVAHPYSGPAPLAPEWTPGATIPREFPGTSAWFARLIGAHVPDLVTYRAHLERLPERAPVPATTTLRRVGAFADEINGQLVTDVLAYTAGTSEVAFHTPAGPKIVSVSRGLLTCDYPSGYGGGLPVTIRTELLPDRRARAVPSGPPLRLDAGDDSVAVEVNARPEPSFALWEEIPLAWVAGVSYLAPTSGELPPIRVEITRHP